MKLRNELNLPQYTDYLFMIEYATKAPSGHNTQPWQFHLHKDGIDIHPDFNCSLPAVDPDNRELFVSLGCATENLCIAASHKGYQAQVSITENGVIHVKLAKQDCVPSPLFAQLSERQTNRSIYNGNVIPQSDIDALESIHAEPGIHIYSFSNGTPMFQAIAEKVYAGNNRQMQDNAFKTELQHWMRYNKSHQNDTRDGLSYAVFGAPNLPRFLAKFIISQTINANSQNKSDKKKIAASSHFVLFTVQNNMLEQWINLGRTLERFLLKATEMGIAHAYTNQPNEIPELAEQMAQMLGLGAEYPVILLRMGYGKKMAYSLRRDVESRLMSTE